MGLFSNFPYSDFEKLNLDWVIRIVREYITKYELLDTFVRGSIEEQNRIIYEATKDIDDKLEEALGKIDIAVEELKEYITNNLRTIANDIINQLIESGELFIGTEYDPETMHLKIVLSRNP